MDTRTDAADDSTGWLPPAGPPLSERPQAAPGAPGPVAVAPSPPPVRTLPAPRNELARWARICAIVSVLFNPLLLVSVTAIVLGIVGLHRSHQPPFAGRWDSGRRQAMTGIGIGVFGLVWGVTVLAFFIAWTVSRLP